MSAMERVRHEIREIGLVTLYFLACFLLFLTLKKLLLAEYEIETAVFRTAVISSLIVAKVVVLLDKSRIGEYFGAGPLGLHVLWRSLCYTIVVVLVTAAERLFDAYGDEGDLAAALSAAWASRNVDHFLAMNLAVGLSFLVYNVFSELDRLLGEGGLRRAFLAKRRS